MLAGRLGKFAAHLGHGEAHTILSSESSGRDQRAPHVRYHPGGLSLCASGRLEGLVTNLGHCDSHTVSCCEGDALPRTFLLLKFAGRVQRARHVQCDPSVLSQRVSRSSPSEAAVCTAPSGKYMAPAPAKYVAMVIAEHISPTCVAKCTLHHLEPWSSSLQLWWRSWHWPCEVPPTHATQHRSNMMIACGFAGVGTTVFWGGSDSASSPLAPDEARELTDSTVGDTGEELEGYSDDVQCLCIEEECIEELETCSGLRSLRLVRWWCGQEDGSASWTFFFFWGGGVGLFSVKVSCRS